MLLRYKVDFGDKVQNIYRAELEQLKMDLIDKMYYTGNSATIALNATTEILSMAKWHNGAVPEGVWAMRIIKGYGWYSWWDSYKHGRYLKA